MNRTTPTGNATTVPPDVVLGAHTFQHALATEPKRESQRRVQFGRHEVQTFMEEGGSGAAWREGEIRARRGGDKGDDRNGRCWVGGESLRSLLCSVQGRSVGSVGVRSEVNRSSPSVFGQSPVLRAPPCSVRGESFGPLGIRSEVSHSRPSVFCRK